MNRVSTTLCTLCLAIVAIATMPSLFAQESNPGLNHLFIAIPEPGADVESTVRQCQGDALTRSHAAISAAIASVDSAIAVFGDATNPRVVKESAATNLHTKPQAATLTSLATQLARLGEEEITRQRASYLRDMSRAQTKLASALESEARVAAVSDGAQSGADARLKYLTSTVNAWQRYRSDVMTVVAEVDRLANDATEIDTYAAKLEAARARRSALAIMLELQAGTEEICAALAPRK